MFAVAFNLLGSMAPALVAANLIRWLYYPPAQAAGFYLIVALPGVVFMTLNFAIVAPFQKLFRGEPLSSQVRLFLGFTPSYALNIALLVAGATIYLKVGLGGIIFALLAVGAFYYQAHLVDQAHQRSEQYVSLSWGVLAGLIRRSTSATDAPPGTPPPSPGSRGTWPRASGWTTASRSSRTRRACCTTSGTSRCRTGSPSVAGR